MLPRSNSTGEARRELFQGAQQLPKPAGSRLSRAAPLGAGQRERAAPALRAAASGSARPPGSRAQRSPGHRQRAQAEGQGRKTHPTPGVSTSLQNQTVDAAGMLRFGMLLPGCSGRDAPAGMLRFGMLRVGMLRLGRLAARSRPDGAAPLLAPRCPARLQPRSSPGSAPSRTAAEPAPPRARPSPGPAPPAPRPGRAGLSRPWGRPSAPALPEPRRAPTPLALGDGITAHRTNPRQLLAPSVPPLSHSIRS